MRKERCDKCKWWGRGKSFACQRYPPTIGNNHPADAHFPWTARCDWCGEFEVSKRRRVLDKKEASKQASEAIIELIDASKKLVEADRILYGIKPRKPRLASGESESRVEVAV